MTFFFIKSFYTSTTGSAPRDAASMPIIPEPMNMSRKERPSMFPSMENTDSLILSMEGRMTPLGHRTWRPL